MHGLRGGTHPLKPVPDGSRSVVTSSPDLDRVAVLFRAHFEFVRRVLRRCAVAEADLDDAVQEVFLVVHRRIDDFEGRSSETTWLYAVAIRVASTLRRSASREHARREKAGAQMHGAGDADPERELSRLEAAALLDRLLDELDSTKRTVFVLAELEGVPVPEIAEIMEANLRTTHSRLRLARKRFSDALQRHHAQEAGRVRRTSLRTLARRGQPTAAEPNQPRAAWAALALRISEGATPMAIAWTGTTATATATGFWIPFAVTVALGAGGLGIVAAASNPDAPATDLASAAANPAVDSPPSPTRVVAGPATAAAPSPQEPRSSGVVMPETPSVARSEPQRHTGPPKVRRSPQDTPEPEVVEVSTLEAETLLLESARARLRAANPTKALVVLDEHRRRFPKGLLAAERRATRVKALCQAGRVAEAGREAGAVASLKAIVASACN